MLTIVIDRQEEHTGNETSVVHTKLSLWHNNNDGDVLNVKEFLIKEHPALIFKVIGALLGGIQEPIDLICEVLGVE